MCSMTQLHIAVAALAALIAACGGTAPSRGPSAGPSIAPTPSVAATAPEDVVRIPLSGAAPGALVLAVDRAWVLAGEGGTLMEVDLVAGRELRSIEVGFGATHLVVLEAGVAAVGRFDDSGNGSHLVLADIRTEAIRGVPTGAVGGLALGEDGIVWALEQADRLVKVDIGSGEIVAELGVDIGENVHIEVQWGAGSAWVGSDGTPVLRVDGGDLAVQATIAVPSGLPFLFQDGLVWGAGPTALWAIDPATNEVIRNVALHGVIEILGMAVQGDEAWLAVRSARVRRARASAHAADRRRRGRVRRGPAGRREAWPGSRLGGELPRRRARGLPAVTVATALEFGVFSAPRWRAKRWLSTAAGSTTARPGRSAAAGTRSRAAAVRQPRNSRTSSTRSRTRSGMSSTRSRHSRPRRSCSGS